MKDLDADIAPIDTPYSPWHTPQLIPTTFVRKFRMALCFFPEIRRHSGTTDELLSQEPLHGNFNIAVAGQRQSQQNHKEPCHGPTGIVQGMVDVESHGQNHDA